MSSPISPIVYPALRSLLVNRLQKSLNLQEATSAVQINLINSNKPTVDLSRFNLPKLQNISLKRVQSRTQLKYISALAFQLSAQQHALILAQQIVTNLNLLLQPNHTDSINSSITARVWQNFSISAIPPGWIELHLSDAGIAEWLQLLTHVSFPDSEKPSKKSTVSLHSFNAADRFTALHSHARCCALLRMAAQEKLLQLQFTQTNGHLKINLNQPLPWLNTHGMLRCQQDPEWNLILQINDAIDYLAESVSAIEPKQTIKVVHNLSQAFQTFHAACRIWGEVKTQDLPLAQVRLGLVLATQKVLQTLLEQRLNLPAINEI